MPDNPCPGCGAPITPADWIACVTVERTGQRAHLACLDAGLPDPPPGADRGLVGYHLARRTMPAAALAPGARFVALAGDCVLLACWTDAADAQIATLHARGYGVGGRWYERAGALAAAQGGAPVRTPPAKSKPPGDFRLD